jgi:hypothetical protein
MPQRMTVNVSINSFDRSVASQLFKDTPFANVSGMPYFVCPSEVGKEPFIHEAMCIRKQENFFHIIDYQIVAFFSYFCFQPTKP